MNRVPRVAAAAAFAALFLACGTERSTAPMPELVLRQDAGGNPACALGTRDNGNKKEPVGFLCSIEIPGNPLSSSQKGWVEQSNGMYYLSDASNSGVDVIDIATHTYVGRIPGFVGAAGTNGAGPSSF